MRWRFAPGGCTKETQRCEIRSWLPSGRRPDCCTQHLLEVLEFTDDLLRKHEIPHWLEGGTLLGAVRNGELIPWDDDVDIGMFSRDVDRVAALEEEVEAAGYVLDLTYFPIAITVKYSRANEAHADLLPWTEVDGVLENGTTHRYDWPGMQDLSAFPVEFVKETGEVTLHGRSYPAPSPVHEFLRDYCYGPDYMTPRRKVFRLYREILMPSEAFTPRAHALYDDVARREEQVYEAAGRRFGVRRANLFGFEHPVSRFTMALPKKPSREHLSAVLAQIPEAERTPTVDHLARTLATLDTALDEIEHPTARIRIIRLGRRIKRGPQFVIGKTVEGIWRAPGVLLRALRQSVAARGGSRTSR